MTVDNNNSRRKGTKKAPHAAGQKGLDNGQGIRLRTREQ